MPFTIPNEADAFHQNQAEVDKVDIDILVAGQGGDGVVSGCAVTAQGSPDMTVAVAGGVVKIGTTVVAVTSGNVTIGTADSTNPRIDLSITVVPKHAPQEQQRPNRLIRPYQPIVWCWQRFTSLPTIRRSRPARSRTSGCCCPARYSFRKPRHHPPRHQAC